MRRPARGIRFGRGAPGPGMFRDPDWGADRHPPPPRVPAMKPSAVQDLAKGAGLFLVYVALARLGLMIQPVSAFASLVWAPSGIALAAILTLGRRFWPAIFLGALAANVWTGAPVPVG